jgi:hypothetical protein
MRRDKGMENYWPNSGGLFYMDYIQSVCLQKQYRRTRIIIKIAMRFLSFFFIFWSVCFAGLHFKTWGFIRFMGIHILIRGSAQDRLGCTVRFRIYNSFCFSCGLATFSFCARLWIFIMIFLRRIFLFAYSCGCLGIKSILHGFFFFDRMDMRRGKPVVWTKI